VTAVIFSMTFYSYMLQSFL